MLSANEIEPGQGASAELMFLVRIPMRDGLHLAANIFLPRHRTGPVPALVELTPYSRDTATADGNRFAHAGFVYVVADCRGRGDSEGVFYGHEGEISDSRDLIDWIAAQPWCDGQVSGFGGSYTGHNQWSMAVSGSPHLRSIAPGVASNPGETPSGGGIPSDHQFGWGFITAGKTLSQQFAANASATIAMLVDAFDRRESFRDLNQRMGGPWALPDTQNTAPQTVPFGERIEPHESLLSAVSVPSLEITSPYDIACRGALDHHRRIHAHGTSEALAGNYLVLGPWDHGGAFGGEPSVGELTFAPAAAVDMTELMIEWWRWAMCDGPFPAFLRDHVVYYVTGVEEWRWAPDLAAITDHTVDWYLQGHDGRHSGAHPGWLTTTAVDSPAFAFVCDPDNRTTLELERQPRPSAQPSNPIVVLPPYHLNLADHLSGGDPTTRAFVASIDGFGAVYTSEVLSEAVEFAGRPSLDLWLTVDQPDVDLAAMLYELRADGTSILLSPALQRLRHRDTSKGVQFLEPGVPTPVTLKNFHWFARRVPAGSRLQLAVRHTGSIHLDRNHHTGRPDGMEKPDDVRVANVTILHSGDHRSVLRLPIASTWQPPES